MIFAASACGRRRLARVSNARTDECRSAGAHVRHAEHDGALLRVDGLDALVVHEGRHGVARLLQHLARRALARPLVLVNLALGQTPGRLGPVLDEDDLRQRRVQQNATRDGDLALVPEARDSAE